MAFTFPLALGSFANQLRMAQVTFRLEHQQEISGKANGQAIAAELAPSLWAADVNIINMEQRDALRMQSIIEALDGAINDFYLYDPRCAYPYYDPDGSILSGLTVRLKNIRNANEIKLEGLTPGFELYAGEMFHFNYGGSNQYRALHRIVSDIVANGSGETDWIEIRPYLADPDIANTADDGAGNGKQIDLVNPAGRFKMLEFDPGSAKQVMTSGMAFKARQVP